MEDEDLIDVAMEQTGTALSHGVLYPRSQNLGSRPQPPPLPPPPHHAEDCCFSMLRNSAPVWPVNLQPCQVPALHSNQLTASKVQV